MPLQKVLIWRIIYIWNHQRFAVNGGKVLLIIVFRAVVTQLLREDGTVVIIKGHQAFVESLVMEGIQADTVLGIEAFSLVRLVVPRNDVAGYQ